MENSTGSSSSRAQGNKKRPAGLPHLPREIEQLIMSYAGIGDIMEVSPARVCDHHNLLQTTISASSYYKILTPITSKRTAVALPGTPSKIFEKLSSYEGLAMPMKFSDPPLWDDHYILSISPSMDMWTISKFLGGLRQQDTSRIRRIAFNDEFCTANLGSILFCLRRFSNLEELILVSELLQNVPSPSSDPRLQVLRAPHPNAPLLSDTFEFVHPPLVWPYTRDKDIVTPWERCLEVQKRIKDTLATGLNGLYPAEKEWLKDERKPPGFAQDIKLNFVWIKRNGFLCPSNYVEPPSSRTPDYEPEVNPMDEEFIFGGMSDEGDCSEGEDCISEED